MRIAIKAGGSVMLTADQMLIHISSNIPNLMRLATAVMYVMGMYIIVVNLADMRNAPLIGPAGQQQKNMWTLWKHVFVGAALIYFPSTIHVATATMFSDTSPIAYVSDNSQFQICL